MKKNILFVITLTAMFLNASEPLTPPQTDSSKPAEALVTIVTNDQETFEVPTKLIKKVKTIQNMLEDIPGLGKVDLSEVDGKTFLEVLNYLKTKRLNENLSVEQLVKLLRGVDYLEFVPLISPTLKLLVKKLTWNPRELEIVFGTSRLAKHHLLEIAKQLAQKRRGYSLLPMLEAPDTTPESYELWTLNDIKALYLMPSIAPDIKLALIKQLIENHGELLAQIVDSWNIHVKRTQEQGRSLMPTKYHQIKPSEADRVKLEEIKKIIGERDYEVLVSSFMREYPNPS